LESAIAKITFPENIKIIKKLEKIPMLTLDSEHIQRVFVNIIENAVQSMPEGGELIVGLSRFKDSIEISFKDSGVGITEENMKKLFTPLFTTKPKGLGLGLVISKQIVEGHKGEIVVTSKEGEGTIFTVRLPIRLEEVLVKDVQLDINVLNLGK
jgi:signal transduction histidine kinase